jgi:hypothetical protein
MCNPSFWKLLISNYSYFISSSSRPDLTSLPIHTQSLISRDLFQTALAITYYHLVGYQNLLKLLAFRMKFLSDSFLFEIYQIDLANLQLCQHQKF